MSAILPRTRTCRSSFFEISAGQSTSCVSVEVIIWKLAGIIDVPQLTPEGERLVAAIADRYRIGAEAVKHMLEAIVRGGGTMAQFNVPELGGSGQWMLGGMTMVGDMFNNTLKATVDNLCMELSNLLANQPGLIAPVNQQQSHSQGGGATPAGMSLFVPQSSEQSGSWWPAGLGYPSSTGSQNSLRYAYFPDSRRLAIDYGGRVELYDTLDHNIQGFGQQQSGDASLTFTSQRGIVRVDSLPRVSGQLAEKTKSSSSALEGASQRPDPGGDLSAVLTLLDQLGQLKDKGILTEEEFAAKKADLLKRL